MTENERATRAERRTSRGAVRRRLQGLAGGGLGFVALATILLLAAPMSSAHGTVSFTAPYTAFAATPSTYSTHYGCSGASTPVPAGWNLSLGRVQFSSLARAGACSSINYGYAEGTVGLVSPTFSAPAAGAGYVFVSMNLAVVARGLLSGPSGNSTGNSSGNSTSGGDVTVALYVLIEVVQVARNNGTTVGSGVDYLVDQSLTTSGSFLVAQRAGATATNVSATFAGGHLYEVEVDVTAYVFAETYGGGSTAVASIDLGGSHGLSLGAITAV
jgi:hypothetical protein